ncbi:MAG: protein-glutamate O-methyltransferase CheR, partial [Deltaproteobacteria bacterium]|nr:protein-glutamate O-methyltransferase CheR [Deltaproteobacteria bacterium]
LRSRLGKIVRRRGLASFQDYLRLVEEDATGDEITVLLDAVSTNVTSFFREADHFRYMEEVMLPRLVEAGGPRGDRTIRGWSAGCSTGEEPYSIAVTLLQSLSGGKGWDIRLLATDLSTRVLSIARNGLYAKDKLKGVSSPTLSRYFAREAHDGGEYYRVHAGLRGLITYARLNLMEPYPFQGPFDFIFCRNVMIYFDRKTQETLVNRFHRYLAEDGHLFIGHSESLNGVSHPFQYVRPSVYRKREALP